ANAAFARTSFLYGGNADYIENLYARYETDPTAVDPEWRAFFQGLKDTPADVMTSVEGPSLRAPPLPRRGGPRDAAAPGGAIGASLSARSATRSRYERRPPASTFPPPKFSRQRAIRFVP